jgi:hypothetical protein
MAIEDPLRNAAARGLAEYGDSAAFETLLDGWEKLGPEAAVALQAVDRFSMTAGREAINQWLAGGPNLVSLRCAFIDNSGRFYSDGPDELLEEALADPDMEARRDAVVLYFILRRPDWEQKLNQVALDDPEQANRRFAASVLARSKRGE